MVRRRDFLRGLGAFSISAFAANGSNAQPRVVSRAAIVIGVDKAGDLPPLGAAASGAHKVADWLKKEGFEVKRLIDDSGPVHAHALHNVIDELVQPGALDQLVIYFAGHGFLNAGSSEVWLLSDAPGNSSEAVNLNASVLAARDSGLGHVVFISDACRSTPDSLRTSRVQGYDIFPNLRTARPRRPDVDRFFAALPGRAANEIPVSESVSQFAGIYTTALLAAFHHPTAGMIKKVNDVDVIPNRMLKGYLGVEVPKRAQEKSIRLNQKPDAILECDESYYIARVAPDAVTARSPIVDAADLMSINRAANRALKSVGLDVLSERVELPSKVIERSSESVVFQSTTNALLNARAPASFETGTGISVHGAWIEFVVTSPSLHAEHLGVGSSGDIIRIDPRGKPAGSVVLGFQGGGGTVIAALANYIATVVVHNGQVVNVTYVPSRNSGRWSPGQEQRIARLRATVAASAQFGVFRIGGDRKTRTQNARHLADEIRVGKAYDPTLGLYAAYAYADADIVSEIQSVQEFMRGDLGIDFFDVAMLSGRLSGRSASETVVPFCPMLSQGWDFLRVKGVRLAPDVQEVRNNIQPALWTTFDHQGIRILASALSRGRVL